MNIPKLKGKIREQGKTYAACAEALGLSTTGFFNKIKGLSKFNIEELDVLGNFLGMNDAEKADIFLH